MHTWQLQQAKSRFSELVDLTLTEGAQMVTRRGKAAAVVLSAEEYEELSGTTSLRKVLLNAPRGDELDIARSNEYVRETEL